MPCGQFQQLTFTVKPPVEQLAFVMADSEKLKEVIINLIGNSLKFTPAGGSISISFTRKNEMVLTSITDTGKRIKSNDISKLFQKFGLIEGN